MRRLLPLFAILCVAFAPAPFPRVSKSGPSKDDLKALQGKWHRVRVTIGGVLRPETGKEPAIVVADNRMDYTVTPNLANTWVFTLDGTTNPTRFDRKGIIGCAKGFTYLGIYRIEGDTFTLCSCDGYRPKSFGDTRAGVFVEVFKRTKP
jgi:uncharacterized protein (TIGR03067 family)